MRGTKFLFRVDASVQIGNGHVMRCLTLAGALHQLGAECSFACHALPGDLRSAIERVGYRVWTLNPRRTLASR